MAVPVVGQLTWLGSFLLIDRSNPERSRVSIAALSARIREDRINLWLMPEGTRSREGALGPFKTGFVHLALATGLPVVPVVLHDSYRLWPAGTLRCRPGEVLVEVLDSIDSSHWKAETAREHAANVRELIRQRLVEGCLQLSYGERQREAFVSHGSTPSRPDRLGATDGLRPRSPPPPAPPGSTYLPEHRAHPRRSCVGFGA